MMLWFLYSPEVASKTILLAIGLLAVIVAIGLICYALYLIGVEHAKPKELPKPVAWPVYMADLEK